MPRCGPRSSPKAARDPADVWVTRFEANLPREALRLVRPNSAGTCTTNERVSSVMLANVLQQCACVNPTLANGPFWRQSLRLATACGSTLDTVPLCPFNFTPPGMVSPFPTLVAWSGDRVMQQAAARALLKTKK